MRRLICDEEGRQALLQAAKHHAKPYVREKAKALLLVLRGLPAATVAVQYLVPAREPDTLYAWMDRFEQAGVAGLLVQPGRGRKGAFSPAAANHRRRPGGGG
jgi:hypothetical protein